ncbi:MAG: pimeloyl-ACP methyl ester carboxylesterase [Phenylobacterium sp.]|jgi:pimeloyl-ACP methyl ester carboxylesterase
MIEAIANVNDVDIAYQLHGESGLPVLLLISGLSTPLSGWPTDMVQRFVDAGFQVLLFDNRDMGKSQLLDQLKIPHFVWTVLKIKWGFRGGIPYQLEDMMQDTVALLDHLKFEKVHVVGASMGGMIAQLLAIHYGERVESLTSIMSTTGYNKLPPIEPKIRQQLLLKPASKSHEDRMAYHINKWCVIGSPAYPASKEYLQGYVAAMLERGITAKGTIRQLLAIMAAKNRTPLLHAIKVPSLVLHGDCDGLINVAGGEATANAITNAQLKIYPGMGHDFPQALVPTMVQDIVQFIHKNQQA